MAIIMKTRIQVLAFGLIFSFMGCHTHSCMKTDEIITNITGHQLYDGVLKVTKPAPSSTVSSPVEICFSIDGFEVEPAINGNNEGKGHHHVLVDVPLPGPDVLSEPMIKDQNYIHLGNGESCRKIYLEDGPHTIRGVFSYGNHILYVPLITDVIFFHVVNKEEPSSN